jgi:hypothetical protein
MSHVVELSFNFFTSGVVFNCKKLWFLCSVFSKQFFAFSLEFRSVKVIFSNMEVPILLLGFYNEAINAMRVKIQKNILKKIVH